MLVSVNFLNIVRAASHKISPNVMQHYLVKIFWSHEDEGYIATVPDLPGCCAWDATEFEALREIQDAAAAWIEAYHQPGEQVSIAYCESTTGCIAWVRQMVACLFAALR